MIRERGQGGYQYPFYPNRNKAKESYLCCRLMFHEARQREIKDTTPKVSNKPILPAGLGGLRVMGRDGLCGLRWPPTRALDVALDSMIWLQNSPSSR